MTPEQFIDKWSRADRIERQAAQEHFIDLCRVLGEPTPNETHDPDAYSFEKGVSKIDGSSGFADVWKRGCFGWEYKKDRAKLTWRDVSRLNWLPPTCGYRIVARGDDLPW